MSDVFVYTSPADPRAQPLVDELSWEYDSRYGEFYQQSGEPREMEKYPPAVFSPPEGGNFVLLLRDGVAVAGGAFKRHDDPHTAEFKRIWTDRRLRRQGLARRVLVELEAQALRQAYRRVYLTTGFRQPEAVGLYLTHGYTGLYDPTVAPIVLRRLPFEKWLLPAERPRQAVGQRRHAAAEQSLLWVASATPGSHADL